jgi:DNA replication protein DnaC
VNPAMFTPAMADRMTELLALFRLPTMANETIKRLEQGGQRDALPLLLEVLELENSDRRQRRVERLRRASRLPPGKTLDTLQQQRLPKPLTQRLHELAGGQFLDRTTNVLCFGLPGTGKTHAAAALGHALVEQGRSVLFTPTYQLVQDLLVAKRDLVLPRALRKLDNYELLILDDIGYVQQSADEIEVLFTLMAERYERRSILITSNLVFGEWDRIFKNPMTTAAAIDRLVHHSAILEFHVPSFRTEDAKTTAATSQKSQSNGASSKRRAQQQATR